MALRFAAAVGLGVGLILGLGLGAMAGGAGAWLMASGVFLAASMAVARGMARTYPHDRLGACNLVTLMRLAISCALLAPLIAGAPGGWRVGLVAGITLVLDGADGWLARRSGLVSAFGARFDIEVDAAFALILTLHVLAQGVTGPEVLILGLIRYAFVGAGLHWRWLQAPLPPSQRRKLVCVGQLAVLIALQLPGMPEGLVQIAVWLAALALLWSFWTDIRWLYQRRG